MGLAFTILVHWLGSAALSSLAETPSMFEPHRLTRETGIRAVHPGAAAICEGSELQALSGTLGLGLRTMQTRWM